MPIQLNSIYYSLISPDGAVARAISSPLWSAAIISALLVLFLSMWFKPRENKPRKYVRTFLYFGALMFGFLTLHRSLVVRQFEPSKKLISEDVAGAVEINPIHEKVALEER